jgi:hypothetical protein
MRGVRTAMRPKRTHDRSVAGTASSGIATVRWEQRRNVKLRRRLSQLVAGAVAPLLVLAAFLGVLQVGHERATFRQGAVARTRAFMTAVDAQLRGNFTALEALATARSLQSADLRAFHDDARRALRSQPHWRNIILETPSGRQLAIGRRGCSCSAGSQPCSSRSARRTTRGAHLAADDGPRSRRLDH